MSAPLSRKWNPKLYEKLSRFVRLMVRRDIYRSEHIPNARTMPDLSTLGIGSAKRMTVAILFFDFEDFTAVTSHLSPEKTLMLLNIATTTVMWVVREWNGTVEKHTGDGVMAILGTETSDHNTIACEAIETAQTIQYIMKSDVFPHLEKQGLPVLNFRIGVEMGEVLISKIGLHSMNFLTAVGSPANRASKLEGLAQVNGIAIGETLARNLHVYLHDYLELGTDQKWDWHYDDGETQYNYYHYSFEWKEPRDWLKKRFELKKRYRNQL